MAWRQGLKKAVSNVSAGAKKRIGTTWHPELEDKVESICTHAHWAIRNCNGDIAQLRRNLTNIVDHYKNNHDNCHPTSRCVVDPNYEPSRIVITEDRAADLLLNVITRSTLYKSPRDFMLAMDTYYVESFNNSMNMFQDKRISFGDLQYSVRSQLAACHWNENVDREFTSIWHPRADPWHPRADPRAPPPNAKGKKVYKKNALINIRQKYGIPTWTIWIIGQLHVYEG